jgi:small subunit ribosomal protein S17
MTEENKAAVEHVAKRKTREGTVVSNAMDKTVVVSVDRVMRHPLYGKTVRRSKKFKAHDEDNRCLVGDLVRIRETRPLSKDKNWVVEEILRRSQ